MMKQQVRPINQLNRSVAFTLFIYSELQHKNYNIAHLFEIYLPTARKSEINENNPSCRGV